MSEFAPEDFLSISVADVMRHPRFNANLRDLILALDEKRGEATIADLAEIIGKSPEELIQQLIGETVFAEYRRLVAEASPRAN